MSKRKDGPSGGGQRKKKSYFQKDGQQQYNAAKHGRGVIITCDQNRERECVVEAYNLLAEYCEVLYPTPKEEDAEGGTAASELEKEIAALKETKKKKPIFQVRSGCKGVIFICFEDQSWDPIAVVNAMFEDVKKLGKAKARYISKIFPITHTCHAGQEEMDKILKPEIDAVFHKQDVKPVRFCVHLSVRNSTGFEKVATLQKTAGMVGRPHQVDLKTPEKVIILQVFKGVLGLGIVDGDLFAMKFNMRNALPKQESTGGTKDQDAGEKKDETPSEEPKEKEKVEAAAN